MNGDDYNDGVECTSVQDFMGRYADLLIGKYFRRFHQDIITEEEIDIMDFVGEEYKKRNTMLDEDGFAIIEDDEIKEDLW